MTDPARPPSVEELLAKLPQFVVSDIDDMLLPNPVERGDWIPRSHVEALLTDLLTQQARSLQTAQDEIARLQMGNPIFAAAVAATLREECDRQHSRAQQAEARLARLSSRETQLRALVEKWRSRADLGFDPEETDEATAYWDGARQVINELAALLDPPQEPT